MPEWLFKINGLRKSFGQDQVVFNLDKLELPQGAMIAIVGASGSGKTTLLNVLGGLLEPDFEQRASAEFLLQLPDGKVLNLADPTVAFPRIQASFVFQEGHLLQNASIGLNLAVARLSAGKTAKKDVLEAWRDFSRLSEEEVLTKPVNQLSGGQQQRVGLARAFSRNPDIIFADEPSSSLDPLLGKEMMQELAAWCRAKQSRTVLWVTHNYDEAALADLILVLEDGKLKFGGDRPIPCPKDPKEIRDLVYGEHQQKELDVKQVPEDKQLRWFEKLASPFNSILKGLTLAKSELFLAKSNKPSGALSKISRLLSSYARWPATMMLASVMALTATIGSAASIAKTNFAEHLNDSRLRHVVIERATLRPNCTRMTPNHLRLFDQLIFSDVQPDAEPNAKCDELTAPDNDAIADHLQGMPFLDAEVPRYSFPRKEITTPVWNTEASLSGKSIEPKLLLIDGDEPLLRDLEIYPLSEFPSPNEMTGTTGRSGLVDSPPCYNDVSQDLTPCIESDIELFASERPVIVSRRVLHELICKISTGSDNKKNRDCNARDPESLTTQEMNQIWSESGIPKLYLSLEYQTFVEFDIAGFTPNTLSDGHTNYGLITTYNAAETAFAETSDTLNSGSSFSILKNTPTVSAVYFDQSNFEKVFNRLDKQGYVYDREMVKRFSRLLSLSSMLAILFDAAKICALIVGAAIVASVVFSYLSRNARSFSVLFAHGNVLLILMTSIGVQVLFAAFVAGLIVASLSVLILVWAVDTNIVSPEMLNSSVHNFILSNTIQPILSITVISVCLAILSLLIWKLQNRVLAEALNRD